MIILIYLYFYFKFIVFTSADLIVEIANGKIEGYERTSPNNIIFRAFQGIPYAKPPVGALRFQEPEPVENWTGTKQTIKDGHRCYSVAKDTVDESEDCLFINVFTPVLDKDNTTLLPVMVYFFGGGFRDGAAAYNVYGPDYLIEHDVIMVSLNYRVGPFGYLSTADNIIPGNAGLKDQRLGLKWVQNNIQKFGGDPTKVVIFGQSAGAASVGLHILSKSSAGLFRGAIAESGSGISAWAYIANPVPYAYELASLLDSSIEISSNLDLLNYLQSVPAKQIDIASTKTKIIDHPLPVIEVPSAGAFLTTNLYEAVKTGDINRVPLFIGANSEEYISLATDMDSLFKMAQLYDNDLKNLVPASFNIVDSNKKLDIGTKIKAIYLDSDQKFQDNLGLTIAFNSERDFLNPVVKHAELQSQYTNVFLYKFSYAGPLGNNYNISLPGAEMNTHGEELYYIFKRALHGYNNSDLSHFLQNDVLTQKRMVKFWTNFAKTLSPTPEKDNILQNLIWPSVTPETLYFVNIDKDLSVETDMKNGRYVKWRNLYEQEAIPPHVVV